MDPFLPQLTTQCPGSLTGVSGHLFLTLIQTLINMQCSLKSPPLKNYADNVKDMEEFDFIVVGAGSAGSVVANRLSENEKWNVLLLEAGGEPSSTSQIPALLHYLQKTDETWGYEVEEQEYSCQGLKNRRCRWHTGRVLGGSSSVNAMVYARGIRYDYDRWAELGNPGWSWNEVLPYFIKSEDNQVYRNNPENHGVGGLLKVSDYEYNVPIKQVLLEAASERGIPTVIDMHNGSEICFTNTQGTVFEGQRYSTFSAFLQTARDRPNLKIITEAYVTKVIINPQTKTAKGVEVKIGEKTIRLRTKKEVILSAGALKSPQILMFSGIGPKEHLEKINIPVIKDLKVGENLQDHIFFRGIYVKVPEELLPQEDKLEVLYQYFKNRQGKLSSVNLINLAGFVNTSNNSPHPDIQFVHGAYPKNDVDAISMYLEITGQSDEIKTSVLNALKDNALFACWPTLLHPKSRGYLRLNSSNPFDKPRMFSNYLKNPEDVETLYRGVKFFESLLETKIFKKYKPEFLKFDLPPCNHHKFRSEEYWKCAIRSVTTTIFHYSGTAKMGPSSDPAAVVDSRLRVYGIKNLRVIDNSIMPYIISANTNAVAIMIGEKGADMIKEDWKNTKNNIKHEF